MLCEKCNKNQATVHMQQIVNGKKTEIHLCPACSLKLEMPISFENLFQGFLESIQSMAAASNRPAAAPPPPCTICGMTYEQFKTLSKLGCEACYQAFSNEIEALLKNVQGSVRHEGKYPKRSGVLLRQKREVDALRLQLKKAIEEENFEDAARLRDQIRSMEVNV